MVQQRFLPARQGDRFLLAFTTAYTGSKQAEPPRSKLPRLSGCGLLA
jgi:hypothetical protein